MRQERQHARDSKQQIAALQEANRRLQNEITRLEHTKNCNDTLHSSDLASSNPSQIRELRQQVIALKWRLVEATRRAELAEATLLRSGL